MRKAILVTLLGISSFYCNGQQVEEYAEAIFVVKGLAGKMNMIVNTDDLKKNKMYPGDFITVMEGLNVLAKEGWVLVTSYNMGTAKEPFPRFVFKRAIPSK
jgi:hypothetical protein